MKVCWKCKIAVLNGCYCPNCHAPFTDYNDEYMEKVMAKDNEWVYAIHECELREVVVE